MTKEKQKKQPYHSLLPIQMQQALMDVAATGRIEMIDATAKELNEAAPQRFHNEQTVSGRRFYHEPRQLVPNAGFIVAYPYNSSRT